jgi:hypothetical protein
MDKKPKTQFDIFLCNTEKYCRYFTHFDYAIPLQYGTTKSFDYYISK